MITEQAPSAPVVEITGTLERSDLRCDSDGNFELVMSSAAPEAGGVWLPMRPHTNRLLVRNIFHGRFRDHRRYRAASLQIECVDQRSAEPPTYAADDLAGALERIVRDAAGTTRGRTVIFDAIGRRDPGVFNDDQTFWKTVGANPRTWYQGAYWSLAEDEALVIDAPAPPESSYWVLAVTNRWMESLDFRFLPAYVSKYTAEHGPAGAVRIVLSATDPGVPNWISTGGHRHGVLVWRWNDAASVPILPSTSVVRADVLGSAVP